MCWRSTSSSTDPARWTWPWGFSGPKLRMWMVRSCSSSSGSMVCSPVTRVHRMQVAVDELHLPRVTVGVVGHRVGDLPASGRFVVSAAAETAPGPGRRRDGRRFGGGDGGRYAGLRLGLGARLGLGGWRGCGSNIRDVRRRWVRRGGLAHRRGSSEGLWPHGRHGNGLRRGRRARLGQRRCPRRGLLGSGRLACPPGEIPARAATACPGPDPGWASA